MPRVNHLLRPKAVLCLLLFLAGSCFIIQHFRRASSIAHDKASDARLIEAYGKLPISFEENQGQFESSVKFSARGHGYNLFLTGTESVLVLRNEKESAGAVLRMKLNGGSEAAETSGVEELSGKANYFVGEDRSRWRTNVPLFSKVRYANVYPGIDLVYYGNQRELEYDFVVAPGADPRRISLNFDGADEVSIVDDGQLLLRAGDATVRMRTPFIYQVAADGSRAQVRGRYAIDGEKKVGFELSDYDTSRTLVIDPVLVYSTYLGGTFSDTAYGIAVDNSGNAYVTGTTYAYDFPVTAGAFQTKNISIAGNNSETDVFITKLNSLGNAAVYSTYLGGTSAVADPGDTFLSPHGNDEAHAIAVDGAGNVFVAGTTTSTTDFPVTQGAYQTAFQRTGAASTEDGFITKLNATGDALLYSTRLGGTDSDNILALAIDANGNAYVTGQTHSVNFPATYGSALSNRLNAFVTKLNSAGTALVYSAVLGDGEGRAIAVDSSGSAYAAGYALSANFAVTPGAFQTVDPTSPGYSPTNGFVTKLNPAGDGLLYSTFLGGNRSQDYINALAIDASGNAYVGGFADATSFPTTQGAYKTSGTGGLGGGPFVTKLNSTGSALLYSTYLTGGVARGLVINDAGEVYATGTTDAGLAVTDDAFQKTLGGSSDAFLTKLNATGTGILYSTHLGGSNQDQAMAIAKDSAGAIYITGLTYSTNFPITQDAFQTFPGGNQFDAASFVAKFGEASSAETYRIKGRLVDASGNGIARARVLLTGPNGGTQFTDPNGNYSFAGLTKGAQYSVTPSSPYYDFSPQSLSFENLSADQTADFTGTVRRFSISGTVKTVQGQPLEGVTVTLGGSQSQTAQTDVNGNYVLSNVSAVGTYFVIASKASYFITPEAHYFTNLEANQKADFSALLVFSIKGQVLDSKGAPVAGVRVTATNGVGQARATTNSTGNYQVNNLPAGANYTVTPDKPDYAFSPASQTFNNLSANQTANFTATYKYGSIAGRITDANGKGMYYVLVTLSGAESASTRTDPNGNYLFSRLSKGSNYTVTPTEFGYAMNPSSVSLTVTEDHVANFSASLKTLKPFTSGNIITTASKYLAEYTPAGTLVQDVIVPFPPPNSGNVSCFLGDLLLDKNGEVEVINGSDAASYLTGYDFKQGAWRHQTYPNWNPWTGYNDMEGIATFGNYVYVTDKLTNDFGLPAQTQGILRIDLTDYSVQRFAGDLTFCHLTLGLDGLLYGIVGGTSGSQINAYNPTTMQLVKTVNLTDFQNFSLNVHTIAVNSSGEIFATGFYVHHFDSTGKMIKSVQLESNLSDIEISKSGQLAVAASGTVALLDQSLNILSSFRAPTGAGHVAFTNTVSDVPTISLGASSYSVNEADAAGFLSITVTRSGDNASAASVDYATSDASGLTPCQTNTSGIASDRCDYATAQGTLRFAAGETVKTIQIPVINDSYVEPAEAFTITLKNSNGAGLGTSTATVTIKNDDTNAPTQNPINEQGFFIKEQYIDFLGRVAEPAGFQFWMDRMTNCPQGQVCDRIDTSKRFFESDEFDQRGFFVYRLYDVSLGRFPLYAEFVPDVARLNGFQTVEEQRANKDAYLADFLKKPEFTNSYGQYVFTNNTLVPGQAAGFVNALCTKAGITPANKQTLINNLANGIKTPAQTLEDFILTPEISNPGTKFYDRARIVMQYFGYLRRDPEPGGFNFWWDQLTNPARGHLQDYRFMVGGFIGSDEYKFRFGQQ